MADNRLDVGLLIHAGVEGLDQLDRVIGELDQTGESTEQLRTEAARLRQQWNNLSPDEQAAALERLGHATNDATQRQGEHTAETERSVSAYGRMKGAVLALGAALGITFAVNKVKDFFSGAVSDAAEFEAQMSTVGAVSGASAADMEKLRAAAEKMGAETKYNATEAAQGLENLARAGLNAEESITVLPSVLSLATANGIDLADSASYITQAVAGMGLSMDQAGRVTDVLSAAASNANTDIKGMGEALAYAAPTAASLGLTVEQTAAYIGKFADAGIEGSRAGTSLNNMMAQFSNPASTFRKELAALGIRTNDFNQAIRQLAAAGPKGEAAINALGMEAGPAFKALLGQGIGALDDLTAKLENAGGTAEEQAKRMSDNLPGAFAALTSAWQAFRLKIAAPILEPLKNKMLELAGVISDLVNSGKVEALGEKIAAVFKDGADAVINFVKNLDFGSIIDNVAGWFENLKTVGRGLNGAFQALAITVNALKAGFATIGIVLTSILQVAANVVLGLAGLGTALSDFFGITKGATEKVVSALETVNQAASDARAAMSDAINGAADSMAASVKSIAGVADTAEDAAEKTADAVAKIPQSAAEASKEAGVAVLQTAQNMADGTHDALQRVAAAAAKSATEARQAIAGSGLDTMNDIRNAAEKTMAAMLKAQQDAREKAAVAAKDAFAGIGVDLDEILRGVNSKTTKAMQDYTYAVEQAMASGQDATKAARAGFEALAAKMDSPQAWAAFKQHLEASGVAMNQLSDGQLKRLNDGIKGLPDSAATAMDALKSKLDSTDLTSAALTKLKQEAATAFQGGELSAKQYKDVLDQIAAKTEEIKQKNKAADASAAEAHGKSAQAAEAEKEALDKNSEAKEKNAEATDKAAKRTRYLYDASKLNAEAINNLDDALNRMNGNTILGTKGVIDMWAKQANAAAEYIKDTEKAVAATDNLTQKISDGTVSMQDIAEATHAATTRIAQLDSTTLNNLHAAIDEARQKLKELEEQARDSADSLEAELAQLRGDDSKTAALEQERKLRELNAKLHEAELRNNAEEIAQYRRALDLQQQIGREKQQQAAAKKAEEQQRRQQQQQQTSGDNGRGSNGGRDGMSAGQVADAWDDRIRAAERRGAQNFANELYNEARRRR